MMIPRLFSPIGRKFLPPTAKVSVEADETPSQMASRFSENRPGKKAGSKLKMGYDFENLSVQESCLALVLLEGSQA
jgi:hypothetical protein